MLRNLWIWLLMVTLLGGGAMTMTGCNTAEGFGEDVESAGEGLQDAVDEE